MVDDKRTRHTKERIIQALIACLKSTSLDRITVKQICETADINRSTFYAHYANPIVLYRLLEQSMTDKIDQHFEEYKSKSVSYIDFLRLILRYFYENSELFLVLYSTDSSSLKKGVIQLIEDYRFLDKTVLRMKGRISSNIISTACSA